MKRLRINNPSGDINVIASKSELHRLLFIAVLRNKYLRIDNVYYSDDIKNTINVLLKCGANIKQYDDYVIINPSTFNISDTLDCGESGTTLRFIIPFVLSLGLSAVITGKNKLVYRPIDEYFQIFDECKIEYKYDGMLPLEVKGKLNSGNYKISGSRSSQFISALLIALSFLEGESSITIIDKLQSMSYVNMTIKILEMFNIKIIFKDNTYYIKPYTNDNLTIVNTKADYSQATFFLIMNALGANINILNLDNNSLQGDYKILDILEQSGVTFGKYYNVISNKLLPIDINLNDNPDLAPALSLYCTRLNGTSYLRGLERLEYKESDRFKAITDMFDNINVKYDTICNHTLIIYGNQNYKSAYIDVKNDHRILFTTSILSMFTDVLVDDLKPQDKSYPTYFNEYVKLGGIIDEK